MYIADLSALPDKIARTQENEERFQRFASKHVNVWDIFFIGRGFDCAICLKGTLKMKEIFYIQNKDYAAGYSSTAPST